MILMIKNLEIFKIYKKHKDKFRKKVEIFLIKK